jgi:hypothetical protein
MPLQTWLGATLRQPPFAESFEVEDVLEQSQADEEVVRALARAIVDAKSNSAFLADAAAALGWETVATRVAAGGTRVRRGDFGEALASAWLEEQHQIRTPVPKLRYQASANQTQPGTDIVGLAITEEPLTVTAIHLVECKLRTTRNLSAGEDAHGQLVEHQGTDFAEVVLFVLERLYVEDRALYDAFLVHLSDRQGGGPATDRFEIFLVYESDSWDERVLERVDEVAGSVAPLRVHSVRIAGLVNLVDDAFDTVGPAVTVELDPDDVDDSGMGVPE